ncbi:uncharacterized protein LOC119177636 [Rhipicephalus microplus]|uniref:uncharacterized protein LOC119177636 n=1 Tax=Rhipicephalus microplus TaxID=6941 RepID=UPI003F6C8588
MRGLDKLGNKGLGMCQIVNSRGLGGDHKPKRTRSPMDGASGSNWTDVQEASDPLPSDAVTASDGFPSSSTPSPYLYHAGRALYTTSTLTPEAARSQYYAAYDPMTGLRIAATLGAIITLFTLFLIYKSKCRPAKPTQPQEGV